MRKTRIIKGIKLTLFIFLLTSFISYSTFAVPTAFTYSENTAEIHVPQSFDNENSRTWESIGKFLVSSHYKTYILYWQGIGGYTDIGKRFIYSIQQAQGQGKIIIFKMTGNSYSMHSTAACYASKIENNTNTILMFHADGYSSYRLPKSKSTVNNQLNYCVYRGILTQKELDMMWSGYEVYKNHYKTWYIKDPRPLE